jgi:diguanylate cyclase (GGDEF)-like protein
LLACLIAAVFGALAFAARRTTFEVAILWAVAAAAVAFTATRDLHESTIMFAAAQLVLLFALLEESYRLAYHDQLTGLPGRRALDERLRGLAGEYLIAMVDIDHFKRFNDRFGHEAGDQALRMIADELARVGGGGRAFRYGGEEFAVLFAGRSAPSAVEALEQLRVSVAARVFSIRSRTRPRKKPDKPVPPRAPSERVTLTVSIGAAISSGPGAKPDEVLRAADQALYRAKGKGRNRVEVTGGLGSPRARTRH